MDTAKVSLPPCLIEKIANPVHCQNVNLVPEKPSPWGRMPIVESVSFNDVMSEQLATILQNEEEKIDVPENLNSSIDTASANVETCDDLVLAQMLQREFDKEHDEILKQEVKKINRGSKVCVSYDKYLRLPNSSYVLEGEESDSGDNDETLEMNAKKHWEKFEQADKAFQSIGRSGILKQGKTTTTKHDSVMCGRRNASKLMEFPPGIDTGDGFDIKLSNNVYNALKVHSMAEGRRCNRVHDKDEKATVEKALDKNTRLILYKLLNETVLDTINGCINTGKEACVYHADSSEYNECVLKVFKTTLNEFQNRDQYIKDDYRFRDRFSKQNPRKVIHMWAEKEMRNLMRIRSANIPCPEVVKLKKHVLVMSFIGKDGVPASKLKDADLTFANLMLAYEQTLDIMKALHRECRLVHADLSEYNLLWYDDKVWVIDVSQSVEITHKRSKEFLIRDCRNICSFFDKKGVIDVVKPEVLFNEVWNQKKTENIP